MDSQRQITIRLDSKAKDILNRTVPYGMANRLYRALVIKFLKDMLESEKDSTQFLYDFLSKYDKEFNNES